MKKKNLTKPYIQIPISGSATENRKHETEG